jgi:hypothetical protein
MKCALVRDFNAKTALFGLHSHWVYLFKEILLSSKTW